MVRGELSLTDASEKGPQGSWWRGWWCLLQRDLTLAMRNRLEWLNPLMFFVMVVTLFPLAVSPEPKFLAQLAPGILWVAALLATLLSMDMVFKGDFDEGALEQLLVSELPLAWLVTAKVAAYWLVTGLPLTLAAPVLALMLNLPEQAYSALALSLLLGTPTLCLLGAIGAALVVGLKRGGILLSLIILPLYIPVLVFGAGSVTAASAGMAITGQLAVLAALLVLALTLAPWAIAAALRISANG